MSDSAAALLRGTVRDALAPASQVDRLAKAELSETGYDADLWASLVSLGLTGIGIAEDRGGSGGTTTDLRVVVEEIGYAGVALPYLTSVAGSAVVLGALPSSTRVDRLLARIAAGKVVPLVHLPEDREGAPVLIEWGHLAEEAVAMTGVGVGRLDLRSVQARSVRTLDNERVTVADLTGADVEIVHAELLDDTVSAALHPAMLLRAAEMVGGARRVLEMTCDHVRTRHQFGRPLGRFQAVQHTLADVATGIDGARLLVEEAIDWAIPRSAGAAYAAGRAYVGAAIAAAQLHGGVGFTTEYPLQVFFRRAKASQLRLGRRADQLAAVAAEEGLNA